MGYNPDTGIISGNADALSIHNALGAASYDLFLCKSDNINKYSKGKPFDYPALGFVDYTAQMAAAATRNYGLNPTSFTTLASLLSGFSTPWGYTKPSGTHSPNSPFRFGDFRNYITTAKTHEVWGLDDNTAETLVAPFGVNVSVDSTTIGENFNIVLEIIRPNAVYDSYLLYPNDFNEPKAEYGNIALSAFKFGIALINTAGTVCYTYITSEVPTAEDYKYIAMPVSGIAEDTYNIVPILSSIENSSPGWHSGIPYNAVIVNVDGKYLPSITYDEGHLPPSDFIIGYSSVVVDENAGTSTITVNITNPTNGNKTVNDLFLYIESEYIVDWETNMHDAITDAVAEYVPNGTKYTSGITYSGSVVAAYHSLQALLTAANGGSNVIIPHGTVQFSLVINAIADALGHPYNQYAMLYVLADVDGTRKQY